MIFIIKEPNLRNSVMLKYIVTFVLNYYGIHIYYSYW
jgi:hypothetical protein